MSFSKLCTPAFLYLVLSLIILLVMIFQFSGKLMTLIGLTLFHLVFILFWAWVLNLICQAGYKIVSWILVLIPIFIVFLSFFIDLSGILILEGFNATKATKPNSFFKKLGI